MLRLVQLRASPLVRASTSSLRSIHSSTPNYALQKFTMPAMSPTMTEGGISSWKKKEGESFAPGDVLLEMETDKATMDVEAQDEGILVKIIVGDGTKGVKVGTSIAVIGEEGDDTSSSALESLLSSDSAPSSSESEAPKKEESAAPKKEESAPSKEDVPQMEKEINQKAPTPSKPSSTKSSSEQPSGDRPVVFASPIAKRLALEKGIPLFNLKGSGPNGRIIKADIESYKPATPVAPPVVASSPTSASKAASAAPAGAAYTDIPATSMRKVIASRLTESKNGAPHYYLTTEVNMDRVLKLREVFNAAAKAAEGAGGVKDGVKGGTKLSVNDFVVKAVGLALVDVPECNSGWHGDFVRQYHKQDISIAVATPTGLITPILTDVVGKGLSTISAQSKVLAGKARDGKLKPEEYQGGSFTISNLGMMGIDSFTAIINPPQSCILAVGGTEKKLVLDETSEKGFKEVSVMKVTMSCDHRVVDGAVGARWMKAFKSYLESPLSFML